MPVWLDILLDIGGYVGFVVIATRGARTRASSEDDRPCGGEC